MHVFRAYFKVMKKQLISVILYGVMFLAITLVITFSLMKQDNGTFRIQKVPVAVINREEDNAFIEGFLRYLGQYVTYKDVGEGEEAEKDALFNREIEYILTIPYGFTDSFLSGKEAVFTKQTVPDSIKAMSVDAAINSYLNLAGVYIRHNPGIDMGRLNSYLEGSMAADTKVNFDIRQKRDTLDSNSFFKYYFNYLGYTIIMCFIIGVSNVMFSFSSIEIRRKHMASPISNRNYNMQLIFSNLIFVMGYLVLFIAAGYICNPYRTLNGNTLLFMLNSFLYGLTALSLSFLVGITVKGKNAIQALATMLSLSLAFISGMFVPQEFLGDIVLKAASFTPAYWYVRTNNLISTLTKLNFGSMVDILGNMVIQIGFAASVLSVSMLISKRKRQQAY